MKKNYEIIYKSLEKNKEYESTIEKVVNECFKTEKLDKTNLYMSITLTNPEEIERINKQYRSIDRPTDVLSFPMFEKEELENFISKNSNITDVNEQADILGDIVISIPKVYEQAKEYNHSFERELAYMVVHGFYHLMGYDHIEEEDKKKMRKKEEQVLSNLGISREQEEDNVYRKRKKIEPEILENIESKKKNEEETKNSNFNSVEKSNTVRNTKKEKNKKNADQSIKNNKFQSVDELESLADDLIKEQSIKANKNKTKRENRKAEFDAAVDTQELEEKAMQAHIEEQDKQNKDTKNKNFTDAWKNAINGIIYATTTQRNIKIQLVIAVLVVIISLFFDLSRAEFLCFLFTIILILFAEMCNTAIETVVDLYVDVYHPKAKVAKDVAAGGVVITTINAIIVGYFLFFDKISDVGIGLIQNIANSPVHLAFTAVIIVIIALLALIAIARTNKYRGINRKFIPSGYAGLAFAANTIIWLITDNIVIITLSLVLAILVSTSRIEAKAHKTSEVIFSACLGIILILIIYGVTSCITPLPMG